MVVELILFLLFSCSTLLSGPWVSPPTTLSETLNNRCSDDLAWCCNERLMKGES